MILGMGTRGLTHKQRKFAELLASGCTKVDAFRQAYPSDRRGQATAYEGSKRVARHPAVAAEVQRLTLLRSPHDAAAQAEHIAARLLELTKSPEPTVALRAIGQWAKLAKGGLLPPTIPAKQGNVVPEHIERTRLLEDLRGLYQKALGTNGQPRRELVVSTDPPSTQEAEPVSTMEEAVQSAPDFPADQDADGGSFQLTASEEGTLDSDEYEWQQQPGSFGKARRVRVRVR